MTREEVEKAIENSKSVWGISKLIQHIYIDSGDVVEIQVKDFDYLIEQNILILYTKSGLSQHIHLDYLFKTKARAEHFLHHTNITRTETLPFLTWEEFLNGKKVEFKAKNGHEFLLKQKQESIYLWWLNTNNIWLELDLTEENFYKAYDECVRLFRGGE